MSWWRAKYKNDHGEYEITLGSKYYERAKAVEKTCQAVIDKVVKTKDDIAVVTHGHWEKHTKMHGFVYCSACKDVYLDAEWLADGKWGYCPNCGAKMDGGE